MKKKLTLLLLLLMAGITANANPIQINTQEDFDNWVAGISDGSIPLDTDVDLNANVIASSTTGNILEEYNGVFNGNFNLITLNMNVVRSDTSIGTSFVGTLNGTIKNLYLDGVLEGNGKFLSSVAYTINASGHLENIQSTVTLVSNISGDGSHGGIIGMANGGSIKNIVFAGKIGSTNGDTDNCGGIVGWGGRGINMENVLMIADMSEIGDAGSNTISRNPNAVKGSNVFALEHKGETPGFCRIVTSEELASGEICYLLNGSSFLNLSWYQNLDEGDPYPGLDSSRGIVYPSGGSYASMNPNNPSTFADFWSSLAEMANAFLNTEDVATYAGATLVTEYTELVATYETSDMESIFEIYKALDVKKTEIETSIAAYKNYEAVIAEIKATLQSRDDFSGPERDFLESKYIGGGLAPGDDDRAPNGSSDYILENRQLTVSELALECERASELLRIAIANGNQAGTDITNLLQNANFADGFNGWQGKVFTGYGADTREGSTMNAAEIWSAGTHNMYQEIVVTKSGVYELQVRGAYRPFDEQMSIQYYPYIYLNGNVNYLQTVIEDYIPVEEAVGGENCNLDPNQTPDRPITNEEGDTIGWAIQGVQGCNVAFSAGRYDNRILIRAEEGDILRVGINHPASEYGGNEWVGIGDIQLTYQGELAEAEVALDRVLASMLARANTLLNIECRSDENYTKYPNYSQALRDRVTASIEKAATATDVATKYEVIQELSTAFKEIIDCKKAYRNFFSMVESIYAGLYIAAETESDNTEFAQIAENFHNEAMTAYVYGTMTTEEATECAIANTLGNHMPTVDENGVYHIASTVQYAIFSSIANYTTTDSNGQIYNVVLDADISMSTGMVIQNFFGTFDGQNHTLTVDINSTEEGAAPFKTLRNGATIKNLIVRGQISSSAKFAATVVAYTVGNAYIDCVQSYASIYSDLGGGDGSHSGIMGWSQSGNTYITNTAFAGSITGNCNNNAGFVGWAGSNTYIQNCLMIGEIATDVTGCSTFGRGSKASVSNSYFVNSYGTIPGGAIQVTNEQLLSGEVTYNLNGGNTDDDTVWRQDLGNDVAPTPEPTHKIVYKADDGTYYNNTADGIQSVTDKKNSTTGRIYNINGIRVGKTKKGLYIIDGKKVMVK